MNIIELMAEVGITSPDEFKLTVNPVQIEKQQAFANAVIKAHEAKLIEGVGEPVYGSDTIQLYTATQVAAAVAKKETEWKMFCATMSEGFEDVQSELLKTSKEQKQRIATLESENTALLAANRDCVVHFETMKVDYDKATAALKVALEALDGADSSLSDYYAEIEWGAYDLKNLESVRAAAEQIKEVLHG